MMKARTEITKKQPTPNSSKAMTGAMDKVMDVVTTESSWRR